MKNDNRFGITIQSTDMCALLVLVILGTLLIMGRDSALTKSFCAISGIVFTKGAAREVWGAVRRFRFKGKLEVEGDGKPATASRRNPPR